MTFFQGAEETTERGDHRLLQEAPTGLQLAPGLQLLSLGYSARKGQFSQTRAEGEMLSCEFRTSASLHSHVCHLIPPQQEAITL